MWNSELLRKWSDAQKQSSVCGGCKDQKTHCHVQQFPHDGGNERLSFICLCNDWIYWTLAAELWLKFQHHWWRTVPMRYRGFIMWYRPRMMIIMKFIMLFRELMQPLFSYMRVFVIKASFNEISLHLQPLFIECRQGDSLTSTWCWIKWPYTESSIYIYIWRSPGEREVSPVEGALDERNTRVSTEWNVQ